MKQSNVRDGKMALTIGNLAQTNAINVIATITLITEQQFVLIVRLTAFDAVLAVGALPRVLFYTFYRARCHLNATGMSWNWSKLEIGISLLILIFVSHSVLTFLTTNRALDEQFWFAFCIASSAVFALSAFASLLWIDFPPFRHCICWFDIISLLRFFFFFLRWRTRIARALLNNTNIRISI